MTKQEYAATLFKMFGHIGGKLYATDLFSGPMPSPNKYMTHDMVIDAEGRLAYVKMPSGQWSKTIVLPRHTDPYVPRVEPFTPQDR